MQSRKKDLSLAQRSQQSRAHWATKGLVLQISHSWLFSRGVQCTEKCECTIMVYFFPSWNKWVTYSYNTEWLNIKVKNESQFEKTVCYPGWSVCESLVVYSGCLSRTVAKMSLLILDSISNWKLEILSSQSGFLTGTKGVLTDHQVRPDFAIQDGNKGHKR